MTEFRLQVSDFRTLEEIDWSPEGVCVLSGPNGAGKSTTLDALKFLRLLFVRGHDAAFRAVDGVAFKRWRSAAEEPVVFVLEVDGGTWKLRFPMNAQGMRGHYGEEVHVDGQVKLRAAMFQEEWYAGKEKFSHDIDRCCAKVLWDRGAAAWMQPLVTFVEGLRTYETYWINQVKRFDPVSPADTFLHPTGKNLWSVLANWQAAPLRYSSRYKWVIAEARRAFPGVFGSIEFDRGFPLLYSEHALDATEGLAPSRAADGVLTGLLHLTAVAGAVPGSLLAFDEVENQLHPHAIRSILAAMRQRADEDDLTIIITTHSPVVLNQFRDEPEQVFVLGRRKAGQRVPAPMTDLHTDAWLAQAKLGSLYEQLAFGSPLSADPDVGSPSESRGQDHVE